MAGVRSAIYTTTVFRTPKRKQDSPDPLTSAGDTVDQPNLVRILVVDDDAAIRQTYFDVLQDQGFHVATADSGRQALQTLMQQSFDVLVVDLKMDGMDGIVFIQEALKIWPWLGVVIVSAYISRDVPDRAAALGVTNLLEKPVDITTFVDTIMAEAGRKRADRPDIPQNNALTLMREHLRLLTNVGYRTMSGETLAAAMRDFAKSVGDTVPADAVAILVQDEDADPLVLVHPRRRVSQAFADTIVTESVTRFTSLSGQRMDREQLKVVMDDARGRIGQGPDEVGNSVSVPLLFDNAICGMLTLATIDSTRYTPTNVSMLYHAANHISAVFTALRKMHGLATRDPLTGIYNRIRLEEEMERAWQTTRRYGASMGVLVIDIDNFKTLNDAYGHTVGDEIIRDFARVLLAASRSTDVVARYGGDEFVAILPHASEQEARAVAERLVANTRNHVFCQATHRLSLTISVGVATSDNPTAPSSSSALLTQADKALYNAKRSGRNRLCVWPGNAAPTADIVTSAAETSHDTVSADRPVPGNGRVLVVEDEDPIRRLVSIMLERDGHTVVSCSRAAEAVQCLGDNAGHFDILLTDIGLPDMSGIELMHETSALDDSIVRIVMTGHATVDNAIQCLREGAYDFIQKPIERGHLTALVRRGLEYRELKIENDRYQAHLEAMVRERSAKLAASLQEVQAAYDFTLEALVRMLDAREHHTGRHSKRVRELSAALSREMGLSAEMQETVAHGAFLHDIGKIAIPDHILLKPGPLDPDEWARMQQHSETGFEILKSSPYLAEVAQIVRQHHERWDGAGYPLGLKGPDIALGARIFHIVDAYDAMRGNRVYRPSLPPAEAAQEIARNSGTQFDPAAVEAFVRCQDELEAIIAVSEESA